MPDDRSGRQRWIAAAAYALVTIPFVSPLIDYTHLADASYEGDSRLLIWTLAWDGHAMLTTTPLFDANIFHPTLHALSWAEHHIGVALFALPVHALSGNPVLAYWIVWLLSFPLNALAMRALAWRVTRDHVAAFGAGLVYAFCFFRMHHAHGHIQLLWTWALPLVPLAMERWLDRPTVRRTARLTALLVLQALTSWYLAVFAVLLALVCAGVMVSGRRVTMRHMVSLVVALAIAAAIVGWFAARYVGLQAGPVAEVSTNAADLKAYLVPPANTWLGQWLARYTSVKPRWIWGEQTLYIGMTTLVIAAIGLWTARGSLDRVSAAVLTTGAIALALSLGPAAGLAPFDLFAVLPGMALLRAPARFALLVMLALALLAGWGAAYVHGRFGRRGGFALAAVAVLFLAESFVVDFPGGKPDPMPIPRVYRHLATLPAGAVLSLPTYRATPEAFRESDYLLFSTAHWRPIVNGFGRQEPPGHAERMRVLADLPSADAARLMRDIGVRYVVLHAGRASELRDRLTRALGTHDFELVAQFEEDYLLRVNP